METSPQPGHDDDFENEAYENAQEAGDTDAGPASGAEEADQAEADDD
jgi:hypothetical protein